MRLAGEQVLLACDEAKALSMRQNSNRTTIQFKLKRPLSGLGAGRRQCRGASNGEAATSRSWAAPRRRQLESGGVMAAQAPSGVDSLIGRWRA